MHRRFLGWSPISTNWIHTFQLPLALGQAIPWLWKANRPYQVESRNKTRGTDDWENLKSVSTPNTSAEQKPIMRTKGSANRNFMSARIISYFFLLNCVTSFEIGWATTSMRLNDSVAKKKKHQYIFFFKRHLNISNLLVLEKERTGDFELQKHHNDMCTKSITF